jgi:hypothetical protein
LRKRFNAAGGAVGKLDNWGLPQHHDARALMAAGKQAWKDTIRPMLDTPRMTHPLSKKPLGGRELDRLLDQIYDTITTDGWIKRDPRRQAIGRGALANQGAEHRVLMFRDASTWLEYQDAFGGGDPFSAMMGHINMMARDVAAMEELGPNPNGMIEWMKQAVTKEAALKATGREAAIAASPERAVDRASSASKRIDDVWGSIRGALETPVNSRWGNGMAAVRSLITSSVLGSAAISSISDLGTQMLTRRFAGLGADKVFSDTLRTITPTGRREAVASGLILDNAMHVFHAQARYVGTLDGPQWASFVADRVLTFSGLTPWTQAGKHAFGMAFQNALGERLGKSFDKLDGPLKNTLTRHGITAGDWDRIRKAKAHEPRKGAKFLRPQEIADTVDGKLAERYLAMIMAETEFAIPSGSHRSRTALVNENRPGTFIGEVLRSFSQFKSFGAVFMILHGARVARMAIGGHAAGGVMSGVTAAAPLCRGAADLDHAVRCDGAAAQAGGGRPRHPGSGNSGFLGSRALAGRRAWHLWRFPVFQHQPLWRRIFHHAGRTGGATGKRLVEPHRRQRDPAGKRRKDPFWPGAGEIRARQHAWQQYLVHPASLGADRVRPGAAPGRPGSQQGVQATAAILGARVRPAILVEAGAVPARLTVIKPTPKSGR